MPLPPEQAWFPTKTYGWGWGLPRRWQGWVVVAGYLLTLIGATVLLPRHPLGFVVIVTAGAAALIALCWWKGERPRWRWGKET